MCVTCTNWKDCIFILKCIISLLTHAIRNMTMEFDQQNFQLAEKIYLSKNVTFK